MVSLGEVEPLRGPGWGVDLLVPGHDPSGIFSPGLTK